MKIAENLNLIIPIYDDDDCERVAGYVHSIPLSRSAFEANYVLLAATFSEIYGGGFGDVAGPQIAALTLRDVAAARKMDAEPLLNEIRRLSCFVAPGASGWETVPLYQAISINRLDADDAAEVMNRLVYFIVSWAMLPKKLRKQLLPGAATRWGAELSSLLPTELIASLQTSTATVSSGATDQVQGSTITVMAPNGATSISSLPS